MILHLQKVDEEDQKLKRATQKKPQKKPYAKPKATVIHLEDDEALLKLFRQNPENVQELRRTVTALQKNKTQHN